MKAGSIEKQVRALAVLGAWGVVACGGSGASATGEVSPNPTTPPTMPSTSSSPPSPPASSVPTSPPTLTTYTMNFVPGPKSAVYIGDQYTLWVALNLTQTEQTYTSPPSYTKGELAPGMWIDQDLGGACGTQSLGTPGTFIVDPGPGKPLDVTTLKVIAKSTVPSKPGDPNPEPQLSTPMCFGYRLASSGVWVWKMALQDVVWDIEKAAFVVQLQVPEGPIDAFRLMSGGGYQHELTQIVLTTKPKG